MTVTVTMRQPENRAAESTAVSVSGPQVPAPAPFRRPRERLSPARDATNNEGPVRLPGLPSLPGLPAFQSGGVGLGVAGTRLPAVGELTASLPPPASASSAAAHHPHGHPHAGVQGPTPLTLHPPPLLPPLSQQHQLPQNHHQHQHHPSSSITNTGARTPDSLHADPAFLSSALPEGKSRTLQGPSAKDWARHRETIIELYRQYPLKKVSELMRKHHGFSASKRMYDKRFREWNVFKNVNSDEKDRLIRRIHTTTPPSPSNVIDKDTISQEDLRKSIRCAKTIPQGLRRSSPTSPSLSSSSTSQSHGSSGQRPTRTGRGGLSISDLVKERDIARQLGSPETSEGQSPSAQASSPDIPVATPSSSSAWSDEHLPVSSVARSQTGSPAPQSLTVFKAQLQALAETPPPTIAPDAKSRSLEIITLSIRDYYDWQVQNIPDGVLPDDFLGHRSPEESTQYWSAIKNSIYLIKLSASSDTSERPDWRAWPALAEAGPLAGSAMTSQPFDFLRNVFATLSPANISARPELRAILLQFLTNEAQNKFTGAHPVPRILRELQLDQDCQEVSRRALQCMLDVFNQRLGRSRAVTFKLLDSLATLLRRNGEFDAAMEIVMELLNSCRQFFGHGSDQARAIENELAHFYMVANEHDLALDHCMSVVRRPTPAGPCQETELFYQDGIAAHTMEDIAEIHQRRGDIEQTITWLERAASIALKVWGPKAVATGHIIDKVATLQRQFGKDLLRSAMLWEARVIAE